MSQKVTVELVAETARLTQGINDAQRQLDGLGGSLSKINGQDLSRLGRSMSLGVTLPLIGVAKAGVETAASFDVTMASLGVNAGIAGKELSSLGDLAIQLGADTVFSANEAADAMLELSKSGMQPASIAGGALASTLDLAATEGIGLSEAATIMANTMNTFGIAAKDSKKVTDLLAAGAVASTASVVDLSSGLKYVGATASMLKIPLDTTVTSLAAMNNAGIDASTAGTSLNRFMLGLIPTTKKAAKEMDELGITFQKSDGTMKSMPEIIDTLKGSMEGMSEAQQVASLKTMFGVEGMRAASTLMKLNSDGYEDLNKQINKNGVASELANARMSGMSGALEALKGSAETAALKIGKALEPAITITSKALTIAINLFTALPGPIQTVIAAAGAFIAILGPVLMLMGALKTSTNLATGALLVKEGVMKAVTAAQWLWNAAMTANPIGIVIALVAALVAGLIWFFTQTEAGQKIWAAFTKFLGDSFAAAGKAISDGFKGLAGWITDLAGNFAKGFNKIITDIGNFVSGVIKFFLDIPSKLVSIGADIVRGLWDGIAGMTNWLQSKISNFFGSLVPGWAKDMLGINSPSKVFAGIGTNVIKGVNTGITGTKVKKIATVTTKGKAASSTNITINAGLGTDPYALGRTVSNALNKQAKVSKVVYRGGR